MKKTLFGYTGRLGSGKAYHMLQKVEELKTTGNSVYMISFADPLKTILREEFSLTKNGRISITPEIWTFERVRDCVIKGLSRYVFSTYKDTFSYENISDVYDVHADDFYKNLVLAYNSYGHPSYSGYFRRSAQMLGTELGRGIIDTIWVDIAFDRVKKVFSADLADYAFIDDVRFINEYERFIHFDGLDGGPDWFAKVIGVSTSLETRARRRGVSIQDVKAQDNHYSEMEIDKIISLLPPDQVIDNNEDK